MIRSQLISKLNLLRANELIWLHERCLQGSAICCSKATKMRYRAPTEITDQRIEEPHFEKNDSLLNLNQVLRQTDWSKPERSKKKFITGPRYDRERYQSDRPGFANKDSTDPTIRQLFIEDSKIGRNYPNRLKLEGRFIIQDVINFGYPKLVRLYYSDDRLLSKIDANKMMENGLKPMKVDFQLIKRYSDLVTPQGLVATVELQLDELFRINSERNRDQIIPLIVVASNVRDPGPLVRTSLACGAIKLLSLKQSTKLLHSKIIRTSCGSIFRMPFIDNLSYEDLETHLPANADIYLCDSSTNDYSFMSSSDGIQEEQSDEPIAGAVESSAEPDEGEKEKQNDASGSLVDGVNYLNVDYFDKPDRSVVLIVNGEKRIADELRQFVRSKNGKRLEIPLADDVESLNVGIAASILISEIRRKYLSSVSSK